MRRGCFVRSMHCSRSFSISRSREGHGKGIDFFNTFCFPCIPHETNVSWSLTHHGSTIIVFAGIYLFAWYKSIVGFDAYRWRQYPKYRVFDTNVFDTDAKRYRLRDTFRFSKLIGISVPPGRKNVDEVHLSTFSTVGQSWNYAVVVSRARVQLYCLCFQYLIKTFLFFAIDGIWIFFEELFVYIRKSKEAAINDKKFFIQILTSGKAEESLSEQSKISFLHLPGMQLRTSTPSNRGISVGIKALFAERYIITSKSSPSI